MASTSTSSDTRKVQLYVKKIVGARYHYAIWIPNAGSLTRGRMIHVIGSPLTGFTLQVKEGFDLSKTKSVYVLVDLGTTAVANITVADTTTQNMRGTTTDSDKFEKCAGKIQPPRIPEAQYMPPAGSKPSEIKAFWLQDHPNAPRCQEWTRSYVAALVKEKLLPDTAIEAINSAPRRPE
ncbi:hypothetical protein A0H81_01384 [Grifola frondosa]|uniref:Uncharacterized protein n=1 Tax=Grifola frondosa TaxID=5627 RepID=A0A1C7MT60_GRIFR|nr:hypothetical protein A0H81_01384 [Grifola frondosa]